MPATTGHRRLLATLSSLSSHTSAASAAPAPFLPPYQHSAAHSPIASGSLRPPYAHSIPSGSVAGPSSSRLGAPYRFTLPESIDAQVISPGSEEWAGWARGLVGNDETRKTVEGIWEETLDGLTRARMVQNVQMPETPYSSMGEYLDGSSVDQVKEIGSVIIRDVVPDSMAMGWAKEVWTAMNERGGDAVYWHAALLSARSNTSVLNATTTLLSALTGTNTEEAYVLAESVREGLASDVGSVERWGIERLRNPWAISEGSTGPSTPLLAHLALTPSSPNALLLPNTILSATYALLRPLFQPVRSRISFYSSEAYLDRSNWKLLASANISSPTSSTYKAEEGLPHLSTLPQTIVQLNPGDMILRHSGLPINSDDRGGQAFLPLSLLPKTEANEKFVQYQRKAYEAGLPPRLGHGAGAWGERGAIRVEETRGVLALGGARAGRMMGY